MRNINIMNLRAEVLDQVMNRWVAKFRLIQATKVLNEKTVMGFSIFELQSTEILIFNRLGNISDASKNSEVIL